MNIKIDTALMSQLSVELGQYSKELSTLQDDIKKVQRNLSQCSGLTIHNNLQSINIGISKQIGDIGNLQKAAEKVAEEYCICESRLVGLEQKEDIITWSSMLDIAGQVGVAGSIISATVKMAVNPGSVAKGALSLVGSGAKIAGKMAEGEVIDWLGRNPSDVVGFRKNLVSELDKYKFNSSLNTSTGAKIASNVGAAVKWAGVALSGYSNLKSNADEYYGDFSDPRLWMETITETVVGEGTKILVGAAVAAVAGASGAWAVGIVSKAAILTLDGISQAVTGQKFTETVSDSILDLAEGAGEVIGNVTEPIFDQISVGWGKLINWIRR